MPLLLRLILLLALALNPFPLLASGPTPATAADDAASGENLSAEDALNLRCLRYAYPEIHSLETDGDGQQWLVFANGDRALYRGAQPAKKPQPDPGAIVDIAASMAQPYPLEPARPPTPAGFAPGRLRAYDLLQALYGRDREAVGAGLSTVLWQGKPVRLSAPAAEALARVSRRLAATLAEKPHLRPYLTSEGGFAWRRIANEKRLSAHAFGMALDLNSRRAPYWRWSHARPHPRQQDYPPEIVAAFEAEGFIWGGKWHEYDLMHFEYRPEIICKARLKAKNTDNP